MPIACPQCQVQNADGAHFCRSCGTSLVAATAPAADAGSTGATCEDCGFVNAAGTRYCAKCGYSLVGTVIVSRRDSTFGGLASPTEAPTESSAFDPLTATTQAMNIDAAEPAGRFSQMAAGAATEGAAAAAPSRTGLWVVLGVLALVILGGGGWWLMKPATKPPEAIAAPPAAVPAVAPAPAPAAPPVATAEPAPAAPAPAETVAPPQAPEADPARAAAQKAAREKAARERTEREARAKTQAEQQQQEQLARQRAAEEERARAAAAAQARPAAPAPAAAPVVRSVKDVCAGRNLISQGICESRECRKPEYAGQAFCKELKASEDRFMNPP